MGLLQGCMLEGFGLGHFQAGSFRDRSLIEGLYTLKIEAL